MTKDRRRSDRGFASLRLDEVSAPASRGADQGDGEALPPSHPRACHLRRRQHFARQERAIEQQEEVDRIFALSEPSAAKRHQGDQAWRPGLVDQAHAVQEMHLHRHLERIVRRDHRLRCRRLGLPSTVVAVTLARYEWIQPKLDRAILPTIRQQVQRQAKRLSGDWTVTGIVDVCPFYDQKSGVTGWSFHVHLTVQIALERAEAKRAIRKAFPYKPDSARGVPRPRVLRSAFDSPGWARYQEKSLLAHGTRQRVVKVGVEGKRMTAEKLPLTQAQFKDWVAFLAGVEGSDFMVWVGHRRYGRRLRAMPCKRQKS